MKTCRIFVKNQMYPLSEEFDKNDNRRETHWRNSFIPFRESPTWWNMYILSKYNWWFERSEWFFILARFVGLLPKYFVLFNFSLGDVRDHLVNTGWYYPRPFILFISIPIKLNYNIVSGSDLSTDSQTLGNIERY